MNKFLFLLAFIFTAILPSAKSQFVTQVEKQFSENVGDSFEIYISTPRSYSTNESYNVVYYLDANIRSGRCLQNIISTGTYDDHLRKTIFVGIGHTRNNHHHNVPRKRDFILPGITGDDTIGRSINNGQSEKFYLYLKQELIPFINRRYKTHPNNNSIIGHSLGGLFVFFCLFKSDDLFAKYFALSPALWVHHYSIYKFIKMKNGFSEPKYLFFSSGSFEVFDKILHGTNRAKLFFDKMPYKNLAYEYQLIKGKRHHTQVPISLRKILSEKL